MPSNRSAGSPSPRRGPLGTSPPDRVRLQSPQALQPLRHTLRSEPFTSPASLSSPPRRYGSLDGRSALTLAPPMGRRRSWLPPAAQAAWEGLPAAAMAEMAALVRSMWRAGYGRSSPIRQPGPRGADERWAAESQIPAVTSWRTRRRPVSAAAAGLYERWQAAGTRSNSAEIGNDTARPPPSRVDGPGSRRGRPGGAGPARHLKQSPRRRPSALQAQDPGIPVRDPLIAAAARGPPATRHGRAKGRRPVRASAWPGSRPAR